jgi:ABC-2 type transport system ATP-binding protein
VIQLHNLNKSYGPLTAVDALDLTIDEGCVFGFIGRNGAGKTTTIRMMMGLLEPTSGTVVIGGHDVRREPEKAKALTGYLPDHPFLYDKLTAYEFLRFIGGLYGVPEALREERSTRLLADFALTERAGELVETYSHGMKQRLALAAALLHEPRILVLDEPMVGLDPQGALDFRRLLAKLADEGRTIFLSTHSLAVAEELCDRIGVLDRGRLVALGGLAELRTRAAAMPAARELRDMNGSATLEAVFLQLISATEGEW